MKESEQAMRGAMLAALLLGDRDGSGPAGAWPPQAARTLAARLAELPDDTDARRRAIARLAAALRPAPDSAAALPGRARALLAPEVPRAMGRQWLRAAPSPRRGYVAPPGLRAVLRRLARPESSGEHRAQRVRRELAELEQATCHG